MITLKKIIFTFTGIIFCLALFANSHKKAAIKPGIVEHFQLSQHALTTMMTQEDFMQWLNKEEKAIWDHLSKILNISLEKFETFKKEKRSEYIASIDSVIKTYGSNEILSQETIQNIKDIMQAFGVDASQVTITAWNIDSTAAAMDTVLFVNEKKFASLNNSAKKYAIGHELIHLIKQDHSTKFFIEKLNEPLTKDTAFDNPYNKLSRFQELRADILSCLHDRDYAQGASGFFKEFINLYGDAQNPSHPKSSLRLELANHIITTFNNDPQFFTHVESDQNNKIQVNTEIVKEFKLNSQISSLTKKEDILSWLENEEKSIWENLEKTIHLSYNQCQSLKKDTINEYYDDLDIVAENYILDGSPLSLQAVSFVQSIMKDFNIDAKQLSVKPCNFGTAAAATDEFIMIDEKALNKLSAKAKKFVVGHELIHYLHKDHSTNFFVKKFAKKSGLNMDDPSNPVNKLFRFQELRADIISSFKNKDYAQGNIVFFNQHIKSYGKKSGPPCHPESSLRLELGTKIASILNNTDVIKTI